MIGPILEAKAEIQKYFCSFFGLNEDIQKSFWNYLTFNDRVFTVCFFFKYLMMETLQAYQLYCKQRTQIAPGPDETTVAKS